MGCVKLPCPLDRGTRNGYKNIFMLLRGEQVKRFILILSMVMSFVLFVVSISGAAETVDRIVAIVNDDVITFSDLNREGSPIFRRISREAPPEQIERTMQKAREDMLSSLIDRMIVAQRAKKLGLSVSAVEVEKAIGRIMEDNKVTTVEFWQQISLLGIGENDYKEIVKNQILQDRVIDYEIRSKVVVNEERMREFYEKNFAMKTKEEAYHLLQMGFVARDNTKAAKEDARQRAEEARRKILAGQDFSAFAKQFSDLPSAKDGGDIGVFRKAEMAAHMRMAITGLQPGQVSAIQEAANGYQFFKLLSDRGDAGLQASYETVKEQIRQRLYDEALNSQFKKWVQELREQAYIKKLL